MQYETSAQWGISIEEALDLHFALYVRDFAQSRMVEDDIPALVPDVKESPRVLEAAHAPAWRLWWSKLLTDRKSGEPRSPETAIHLAPPEFREISQQAVPTFVLNWWPMVFPVQPGIPLQTSLLSAQLNLSRATRNALCRCPETGRWCIELLTLAAPWHQRLAPHHWLLSTAGLRQQEDADRWVQERLL